MNCVYEPGIEQNGHTRRCLCSLRGDERRMQSVGSNGQRQVELVLVFGDRLTRLTDDEVIRNQLPRSMAHYQSCIPHTGTCGNILLYLQYVHSTTTAFPTLDKLNQTINPHCSFSTQKTAQRHTISPPAQTAARFILDSSRLRGRYTRVHANHKLETKPRRHTTDTTLAHTPDRSAHPNDTHRGGGGGGLHFFSHWSFGYVVTVAGFQLEMKPSRGVFVFIHAQSFRLSSNQGVIRAENIHAPSVERV